MEGQVHLGAATPQLQLPWAGGMLAPSKDHRALERQPSPPALADRDVTGSSGHFGTFWGEVAPVSTVAS